MKLFTRYSRIYLFVTISIFLLASIAFYHFINYTVLDQVDEDLKIEQGEIQTYIREHNRIPEAVPVRDQMIHYFPVTSPSDKPSFSTLTLFDSMERENGIFRQMVFDVKAGKQWYRVAVSKSLDESDRLVRSILLISIGTVLLILAASFIINRMVLKRLWRPFYEALNKIRGFS